MKEESGMLKSGEKVNNNKLKINLKNLLFYFTWSPISRQVYHQQLTLTILATRVTVLYQDSSYHAVVKFEPETICLLIIYHKLTTTIRGV